MKCVIVDGFWLPEPEESLAALRQICGEVEFYERTAPGEVVSRLADAEVVVSNKVVIDRGVMEQLPRLRYVGVAATGYNMVDLEEAARRGIVVTNVPAYSTDSVAQTVFAMILDFCQQVAGHSAAVHQGAWSASPVFSFWHIPLVELAGKTLGIVGLGAIGLKVAEIGHAFGMKVIGCSRRHKENLPEYICQTDLESVFRESDFLSMHCPLNEESRAMVNRERLAWMKSTAVLGNTSRGGVIDEEALAEALRERRIAGAAADVLSTEPPPADNPLVNTPDMVLTPHFAWATVEARRRLFKVISGNIAAFLAGNPVNRVN